MGGLYHISDVAGLMGVNPKTLRYYEEQGVLVPTAVDKRTGYRSYDQQAILCLWQTLVMREAGMSMRDLKDVAEERNIEEQIAALRRRMTAIRTSISMLQQLEQRTRGYRVVENSCFMEAREMAPDSSVMLKSRTLARGKMTNSTNRAMVARMAISSTGWRRIIFVSLRFFRRAALFPPVPGEFAMCVPPAFDGFPWKGAFPPERGEGRQVFQR